MMKDIVTEFVALGLPQFGSVFSIDFRLSYAQGARRALGDNRLNQLTVDAT
jgi:hypothetical protein